MTSLTMDTGSETLAFRRANEVLDEMILLALVRGPRKAGDLRAVASVFSPHAFKAAIARLQSAGEIVGEGLTTARVYRLVQRAGLTPALPTVRVDGIEYESVWPLPENPKAPPTVLRDRARRSA